ncbi:hypothetical protein [Xanthomonas arboricola]|uniref:Uncharacterized protein n=4 Tax=Xanthomonas arboricola pv. pruni TaxID=69929 RepID=A0AAP4K6F7_9XANT|nr:hypothetical protein [Xanthomonas arboricola]GAE52087.1 hypothetical protein XPU_3619 [Xanthomonas arboricola pv. pruni str. MAFF 311562]GAE57207.1 hypothetical protein XPR_3842 [Xanthomonas arboricola pv. pruni MAFF 301420]GAE62719.1 hypothetical protein XPN_4625 [Xanthomonas arboricola pv. pruni MAFF 301427]MDN0264756.1 hypothetical protein [Xanthomonas arboricola pv. pruni]MDN0268832.1 hypothetical protein [Xanthomonas arboricola pv. pruni]
MSLGKQFRVCTGVVLSFEMMQGYVLAMLHSDAQPDALPVLIACEATGFDDILPGGDAQSVVLGRLHVCMRSGRPQLAAQAGTRRWSCATNAARAIAHPEDGSHMIGENATAACAGPTTCKMTRDLQGRSRL